MKKNNIAVESTKISNFWVISGLLAILVASTLSRDITRPFYGLHSWGQAHDAWVARSHVRYGLGYTKGFDTFAIGNPPAEKPQRYLDHPLLFTWLNSCFMLVFGVNTWALRIENVIATVLALLLFLKILRGLVDDLTALLAGLLFCLFPLIGYFGVNQWLYPLAFMAMWCYLVLIGSLKDRPEPKKYHKWILGACLFLGLQMTWEGFFFAMAIGVHYVFRCIRRKQLPDKTLLAILVIAPLSSLVLNFMLLAAGHNWDFQRIIELYKWRAGSGELPELPWSKWFVRFWEHAVTNFTLPILITMIVYLTFGQLFVFFGRPLDKQKSDVSRRFPQFWFFLMPAIFQLGILKGTLWPHQYWERPLVPFIATGAALGVMLLWDILKKADKKLAAVCTWGLIAVFVVSGIKGTNYYYNIRWQPPAKIRMFEMLNKNIPSDKALLSFEPFVIDQKPGVKQASYRPEVAWHLDRDIEVARTLTEIEEKKQTGNYPVYLMPLNHQDTKLEDYLLRLNDELRKRYMGVHINAVDGGEVTKEGKFLRVGMPTYMIFDLRSEDDGN